MLLKSLPRIFLFCFLAVILLSRSSPAFALEITYPVIPGISQPTDVPTMAIYLYALSLIVGVMICTLSLIYAGISWLLSRGNPGKLASVKGQINASFLGLAILLLSFVFLKVINPDLVIINLPGITSPVNPPSEPMPSPTIVKNSFWELPFGFLEKDVLDKAQAITSPINYPDLVQQAVQTLEDRAKELQILVNQCKCKNLESECGATSVCTPDPAGCFTASGGVPTIEDLCPNWNTIPGIQDKITQIQTARNNVKTTRQALLIAQVNLQIAEVRLNAAKGLLTSCPGPLDLKSFLGIQDWPNVEKKIFFTNIIGRPNQEIDCDQSAPDIALPYTKDKQATYDLALIWCPVCSGGGNHVLECYNDTVKKARSAGVNPAFALIIWLNESNASNYSISYEDFGIHDSSIIGFTAQINRFLILPNTYKTAFPQCFGHGNDMDAFLRIFRSGNCTDQTGLDYAANIRTVWTFITTCPFPSYPTDTSCY